MIERSITDDFIKKYKAGYFDQGIDRNEQVKLRETHKGDEEKRIVDQLQTEIASLRELLKEGLLDVEDRETQKRLFHFFMNAGELLFNYPKKEHTALFEDCAHVISQVQQLVQGKHVPAGYFLEMNQLFEGLSQFVGKENS